MRIPVNDKKNNQEVETFGFDYFEIRNIKKNIIYY